MVAMLATAAGAQSPFATSSPFATPPAMSTTPQQPNHGARELSSAGVAPAPNARPAAVAAQLPEPVYWAQQLFLIPYKWDSGTISSDAAAVKLFLSQDGGATWNQIADAKPEVQFFNYHAPGDGEYCFSIQTIDTTGRTCPEGPHQVELRVIVDTQNPTVTALQTQLSADGSATAVWQASDTNLDNRQATLEYRTPADSQWQTVPGGSVRTPAVGYAEGQANWQVPAGTPTVWVRLALRDRAGNVREAGAEARVDAAPQANLASSNYRLPNRAAPGPSFGQSAATGQIGWGTAGSAAAGGGYNYRAASTPPPAIQSWPSDGESPVPLGSPGSSDVRRITAPPVYSGDAYAQVPSPAGQGNGFASSFPDRAATPLPAADSPEFASPFRLPQSASNQRPLYTASARPFGASDFQAPSLSKLPSLSAQADNFTSPAISPLAPAPPRGAVSTSPSANSQPALAGIQYLNSLDFEIGYDVDTAGTFGVTRVELWGTRDDGQSWQRLSVDTDNRSPILAAVQAPGDYGLKIVVETAGGIDPVRPRPGDRAEMMIRIDTAPPIAQLTGVRQGTAAQADTLHVEWQPAPSPAAGERVSLAYSSSPNGPWVTAVADLPNNGAYNWRLARHLPVSFYLRLEIRDPAGNTATDQTQVPVTISLPTPSGRLSNVRALH